MRVAGPAEHPVQLDIGVDAGADAAEHLQDGVSLEDHAGVALLGVRHPWRRFQRQGDIRLLGERHVGADGGRVDQRQQELGRRRVIQRVIAGVVVVGADGGDGGVLGERRECPS